MKTNYVLIDYENVQVKSLALLKNEQFQVRVFLGPKNTKLPVELVLAMQELGDLAEYITIEKSGPNALDFHIAYCLGALATTDPSGFFHIISKDTGFDPLIQHLKAKKIFAVRSIAIEKMPCFSKATVSTVEKKDVASKIKSESTGVRDSTDNLVQLVVDDLIKRKASKPRTQKTLLSTIHARCGKDLPKTKIDAVYAALLKSSYIKVNEKKVTYALPASNSPKN